MSRYALIPCHRLLALFPFLAGLIFPIAAAADARLSESYGRLPLHFEENRGQTHEDVRFLSRGPGYSLYLTADEAVLVLSRPNPDAKRDARGMSERRDTQSQAKSVALRMSLVGAAPKPLVSGHEELPGKANYFVGNDPAKWRTNVPTYAKVHYHEVYPGIDLVYYGNQRQLEYDFVVAPGADPKKIVLGFKGVDKLEIDAQGDLVLHAAGGTIRQQKPVIYQEVNGVRQEVAGSYLRKDANRVGFKVATYDTSRPLIIDPVVLSYSTYLGGSGEDTGNAIAVDADGNAYVTGKTRSANFPTTPLAFQLFRSGTPDGITDVFVTKLNPAGTALIYSTYLGGNGIDVGRSIAVDANGNAYITGETTSTTFPTTPGVFQPSHNSSDGRFPDVFVTKLNPTGSGLIYSTYLGGGHSEGGAGIAVDAGGHAYVTGSTGSVNFPTTPGAFQTTATGFESVMDVFVTKLNSTGSALVYSTYLGSSSSDWGRGIAVDADGSAYVTGTTEPIEGQATDNPVNFPVTPGAYQATSGGGSDAFVTKLDPAGSALVYSTFLGGSSHDHGLGIAVDSAGNAYVAGAASLGFPTTPGAFQTTCAGPAFTVYDAFVTKLNFTGSAVIYSTCLGSSNSHFATGIAVDATGNAYVTGVANLGFPTTVGAFQPIYGGAGDAFVTKLDLAGSALVYSTYLGGSGADGGSGIAVDAAGNAYVSGATGSIDFPTTPGAFQRTDGGSDNPNQSFSGDAFIAKIGDNTPPPVTTTSRSEESAASYMGYWPVYGAETGTFSGGIIVASNQVAATATFSFTGTAVNWIGVRCNVCGIATVQIDGGAPMVVNTFGPGVPGSLTSEVVFSASGLAPDVTHTLVITVTGATTGGTTLLTGGSHVAVDAFDVKN